MTEHTNKIAIKLLTDHFYDYPYNWEHYHQKYRMIVNGINQGLSGFLEIRQEENEKFNK